ncbi:MAG TPA: hypothetical protein V6C76_01840 [Drouetiella sp.]
MHTQCVIREVRGTNEFVLVSDVLRRMGKLVPNEKVYVGRFNAHSQVCGPYGSDSRAVCIPVDGVEFGHASDDGKSVIIPVSEDDGTEDRPLLLN